MTDQQMKALAEGLATLKVYFAMLSSVSPDIIKTLQPLLNEVAKAQTLARVEAMLAARGKGLSDADCLRLALEVRFSPM